LSCASAVPTASYSPAAQAAIQVLMVQVLVIQDLVIQDLVMDVLNRFIATSRLV
jgi:hypothetical protein